MEEKVVYTSPKGMSSKMNKTPPLEFEHAYYDVRIHYVNYYSNRPIYIYIYIYINDGMNMFKYKKIRSSEEDFIYNQIIYQL